MIAGLRLAARGCAIVCLTAANVYQIAHLHWLGMFLVGGTISVVWWENARLSGTSPTPYARWWYGLGAGVGTVTGTALMAWVYGG